MRNIFYFILAVVIFPSCEKKAFDHRNKYVGEYDFSYTETAWNMNSGVTSEVVKETIGKVFYEKKENKESISLQINEDLIFPCTIDKNGDLEMCGGEGTFENKNEVSLQYSSASCPGQPNGAGITYSITGIKR